MSTTASQAYQPPFRRAPFRSRTGVSNSNESWHRPSTFNTPSGRYILQGLKPGLISIIEKPAPVQSEGVEITDVKYIASYSWINADKPTIIVPGSPRLWRTDITYPQTVARDTVMTYVDSNGYRFPKYPLLPIFAAADILEREGLSEKVNWGTLDVVTDRNSLRKLLSFAEERSPKDFRIDLELTGNWTLLMGRWEQRTIEYPEYPGYNDSFEHLTTASAPGCEKATLAGHHRVISYDLSGFKIAVRFEVDACIMPPESEPSGCPPGKIAAKHVDSDADALADALSSLALSKPRPESWRNRTEQPYGITVVKAGQVVPQESLVKVKTRSAQNFATFNWGQAYPQLLLGQTNTVMVGVHLKGNFSKAHKFELDSPEMAEVRKSAQPGLKKLRGLLEELQNMMMQRGKEARLSLVCKDGVLQVIERKSSEALLPPEIMARFDE